MDWTTLAPAGEERLVVLLRPEDGEPALPHRQIRSTSTWRVTHQVQKGSNLRRAIHALPVLLDEGEHGEVGLLGIQRSQVGWPQGGAVGVMDGHAGLEPLDRGEPVVPHRRIRGSYAGCVGAHSPEITEVTGLRSLRQCSSRNATTARYACSGSRVV